MCCSGWLGVSMYFHFHFHFHHHRRRRRRRSVGWVGESRELVQAERISYHRICACWSCSNLAVHSVFPQWQRPLKSVMLDG